MTSRITPVVAAATLGTALVGCAENSIYERPGEAAGVPNPFFTSTTPANDNRWLFRSGFGFDVAGNNGVFEKNGPNSAGDAAFGEANRQTMMAQVIDPDPVYADDAVASGEVGAAAVERYRQGKVEQPESIRTTNVGSESSSTPQ